MKGILRISAVVASLIVGVAAFAQSHPQSSRKIDKDDPRVENLVQQAAEYMDNFDLKKAAEILVYLVQNVPENDAVQYYLGMCYYYVGDAERSEKYLSEACRLDPDNFWYRQRLAALYAAAGKPDKAIPAYEALLKDFPERTELQFDLADMYMAEKRYDDVLTIVDKIEASTGMDESTATTRYRALCGLDREKEAAEGLEAFCEECATPLAFVLLGHHYLSNSIDSLALNSYENALTLAPGYVPARMGKLETYRMRADYRKFFPEAQSFIDDPECPITAKYNYLNDFLRRSDMRFVSLKKSDIDPLVESMTRQYPSDSAVLTLGALYFYQTGEKEKSLDCARANVDAFPQSAKTAEFLCELFSAYEMNDSLLVNVAKFHRRFPSEESFISTLIYIPYSKGDYQGAVQVLTDLYQEASKAGDKAKMAEYMGSIGDMVNNIGETKLAFRCYKKALKHQPIYCPTLNNYAYYLSLTGKQLKKAETMSRKTINIEPDNPTYLDTFGWILHLEGKNAEAKAIFKHALLYGGKDDPVMLRHYATVLDSLGEKDLAKYYRDQAAAKEKK